MALFGLRMAKQDDSVMIRIPVKLPPRMLAKIDALADRDAGLNRSDVIRKLLNDSLKGKR